jgi:hypothetical protein
LRFRQTNAAISSNFYGAADNTYNLGSTGTRWKEIWGKKVVAYGSGAVFSCRGSDGKDGVIHYKNHAGDNKEFTVDGGIITGGDEF